MKNKFHHQSPVKIGRISYINVAPIYYGLDKGLKPAWLKMVTAPPSVLNNMMANGDIDISPISSVAYARHQKDWLLLPDLSIACSGDVMSVILVSRYPFDKLNNKRVILIDESATAVELLKFFFIIKKVKPIFEIGTIEHPSDIPKNAAAALIIGDPALKEKWSDHYNYIYDMGNMWMELTGLPFVFAVWAVQKSFARKRPEALSAIIDLFHISKKEGNQHLKQVAASASSKLGISLDMSEKYYDRLCCDLGPMQIKGLESFFSSLYKKKILSEKVTLSFVDEFVKSRIHQGLGVRGQVTPNT
ncbi:MAG: menaquinone biosynthesis protein [Desulfobacterales bacterium]|nr:menaquinone biosynthesis protein [Desulfobacterales bacterium]